MAFRQFAARASVLVGSAAFAAGTFPTVALADKAEEAARNNLFDPEAYERAAKAVREINKSPYAKQVLELHKQQEVTKQQEAKAKESEMRKDAALAAKEQEHVRWEEQRKTMQEEAQRQAELQRYNDELSRKRLQQDHELNRQRNAELVKMQEESSLRQERERLAVEQQVQAERRAAEQYKAELQKQVEREKVLAEAEGRIKEQRENEDVHRRAALLRYQEEARKAVEAINAVFRQLGEGAAVLLTDREKLATTVLGLSAVFLGLFGAREGAKVAGKALDRYLGTPKLIRETSRLRPWNARYWMGGSAKSLEQVRRDFSDVVLPGQLHDQVRSMAAMTANTKLHGAPFRHLLFYGPPGTGKTMAAKRLARTSGLDYAIMSGGDVAPLGGAAVTQLHQAFDWAERSRKGLLLFIDEADAFLGRRSDSMSEGLRGSLNALLFRTGDQSRDFMVVLATNRPGDLDDAVLDRMDEAMLFPLPTEPERRALLALYLDTYVVNAPLAAGSPSSLGERLSALFRGRKMQADQIKIEGVGEELIAELAKQTEGFSGREIAKLMISVQAAVYGRPDATLTAEVLRTVLQHKLFEHRQREAFKLGHHGAGPTSQ